MQKVQLSWLTSKLRKFYLFRAKWHLPLNTSMDTNLQILSKTASNGFSHPSDPLTVIVLSSDDLLQLAVLPRTQRTLQKKPLKNYFWDRSNSVKCFIAMW